MEKGGDSFQGRDRGSQHTNEKSLERDHPVGPPHRAPHGPCSWGLLTGPPHGAPHGPSSWTPGPVPGFLGLPPNALEQPLSFPGQSLRGGCCTPGPRHRGARRRPRPQGRVQTRGVTYRPHDPWRDTSGLHVFSCVDWKLVTCVHAQAGGWLHVSP